MKNRYRYLCVVALSCFFLDGAQASAQDALKLQGVILKEGHLVVRPSVLSDASECQPEQGDKVKAIRLVRNINGIEGLNVVRVRMLGGICVGRQGWIAQSLLQMEPVATAKRANGQ